MKTHRPTAQRTKRQDATAPKPVGPPLELQLLLLMATSGIRSATTLSLRNLGGSQSFPPTTETDRAFRSLVASNCTLLRGSSPAEIRYEYQSQYLRSLPFTSQVQGNSKADTHQSRHNDFQVHRTKVRNSTAVQTSHQTIINPLVRQIPTKPLSKSEVRMRGAAVSHFLTFLAKHYSDLGAGAAKLTKGECATGASEK